jgi:hypothetical protein
VIVSVPQEFLPAAGCGAVAGISAHCERTIRKREYVFGRKGDEVKLGNEVVSLAHRAANAVLQSTDAGCRQFLRFTRRTCAGKATSNICQHGKELNHEQSQSMVNRCACLLGCNHFDMR